MSSLSSCSSGASGSSVSFETAPPSVTATSVRLAQSGRSVAVHDMGMRDMQKRAYDKRNEQYLLIKSPPASGKSRALMFLALDKLHHQGVKKALIAVPEKSIGASFHDEPLSQFGFFADWKSPLNGIYAMPPVEMKTERKTMRKNVCKTPMRSVALKTASTTNTTAN